jgi:tRNA1(Val) A37 N6-methylase TrmN6
VISNASNPPASLVKLAHRLIKAKVKSGDIVIDATVGNGHDTLFLQGLVSPKGKVFGFDIQQAALDSTQAILQGNQTMECVTLIHTNHADMRKYIASPYHGNISAVMFNLGYLPGGDKRIITQTDSTLAALSSAKQLLSIDGIITILAYPGHEGGETETDQVKNWCLNLDPKRYQVNLFESQPDKPSAPKLFAITKMR